MKTIQTISGTSRTGTRMIKVVKSDTLYKDEHTVFLFLDDKHQLIEITKAYSDFIPTEGIDYNVSGTSTEKVVKHIMKDYFSFGSELFLAMKCQQEEGGYQGNRMRYFYPLYEYIEKVKDQNYVELMRLKFAEKELKKQINTKDAEIHLLHQIIRKTTGLTVKKAIEKFEKQEEREAKVRARNAAKLRSEKIKANKKLIREKIKEGYTYIAVLRVWSGSSKHLKFQGESIEFRKAKPTTKVYYEIKKSNVSEVAEKILIY